MPEAVEDDVARKYLTIHCVFHTEQMTQNTRAPEADSRWRDLHTGRDRPLIYRRNEEDPVWSARDNREPQVRVQLAT